MILGVTGFAQSGKDTAAGFLVERGWTKLSFAEPLRAALYALNPIVEAEVDWEDDCHQDGSPCAVVDRYVRVREIVDTLGYEGAKRKYPEYRELLQRMGTDVGRDIFGENFWTDQVKNKIKPGGNYVISDVRFPNEAALVRESYGRVWRIVRPGTGAVNTHISDTGIDSLTVDGVIPNTGDIDHFRELVLGVVGII